MWFVVAEAKFVWDEDDVNICSSTEERKLMKVRITAQCLQRKWRTIQYLFPFKTILVTKGCKSKGSRAFAQKVNTKISLKLDTDSLKKKDGLYFGEAFAERNKEVPLN